MKKSIEMILAIIVAIFILSACGNSTSISQTTVTDVPIKTEAPTKADPPSVAEEKAEPNEKIIADDNYVTVTFEKMYDAVNLGVTGVFYVDIKAQNKTDKEIWVYLDKASVNDEMVPMVTSGIPLYIQPDKTGRNGFIFSFSSLSIDKIEDVKKIEFDLVVADEETLTEIDRISSIRLDF